MPRIGYLEDLTATTDSDGNIDVVVPGSFDIIGVAAHVQNWDALLARVNRTGGRNYKLTVFKRTSDGSVVASANKQHQVHWFATTNDG